ncbi:MAG: hypothetical protein ACXW3Y_13645 [Rhodoplanes sp.]|jgi:hypothetical protein
MYPDPAPRPAPLDDYPAMRPILDLDRLFELVVAAMAAEAAR